VGVDVTFGQAAAFEGVSRGGHAGAADEQSLGDDVPGGRLAGPSRMARAWNALPLGVRPRRVAVDDMIAESDNVFVLARMTGTQRGDFMGMPPAGNTINVSLCDYFRVDNGALIEHWGVMDAAGMMQQLTAP
jgi:hypothetical protein